MKNLNTKSDVYYVEKVAYFAPMHIMKAYIIDDDCNEFIVTLAQDYIPKGYVRPSEFKIIDCVPYNRDQWKNLINEADWCPFITIY